MIGLDTVLSLLAWPLRWSDRRWPRLERWLDMSLQDGDEAALREVCRRIGWPLGRYHHWYLLKWWISRRVRALDAPRCRAWLERLDRSDYAALDAALQDPSGLLLAIPHHGHYILSMIAVAERLFRVREVLVFYGNPQTHPGNALFDRLYQSLFDPADPRMQVIHDDRAGLIKALRGLRRGAVVMIMPDVHRDEAEAHPVEFCGRPLHLMLGTAALARMAGARVLPMVACARQPGLRFANRFGPVLQADASAPASLADYRLTCRLFECFESLMAGELLHWQYVRQHQRGEGVFPSPSDAEIEELVELVLSGPLLDLQLDRRRVLEGDGCNAKAEVVLDT